MKNTKISILMPTYNDAETIVETLNSVKNQTYPNYELIICIDGSNDGTEEIIKNYIAENKLEQTFKYIYQENADQLNAIKNAFSYSSGDYIYILHSDDVFPDKFILTKLAEECEKYSNIDAFIPGKLPIIDKHSNYIKTLPVRRYKDRKDYIAELILSGGNQLFIDMALFKREIFNSEVLYNYLTWNRPFWACIEKNTVLKLRSLEYPTFYYRIFEGNYIKSELGMLCHYNGVIRTLIDASEEKYLPAYNLQKIVYKVFKKFHKENYVPIISKNKRTIQKLSLLKLNIPKEVLAYPFFSSIKSFYKKYNHNRTINITSLPEDIYYGCDIRKFNKLLLSNKLDPFYYWFMGEMESGFDCILCKESDSNKINDLLHFFCLKNVKLIFCESNDAR